MHRHSRFLFAAMLACAAAVGQTTQTVTGTVTFQVPAPIAGPQGPQGAPGTNGTNGATGATGAPGPQGIAGNTPSAAAVAALLATMPGFAQMVAADLATLAPGAAPPPVTGKVSRPSYNTGNGFFVLNGALYDANGNEFRMRGVNRNHYDNGSQPGMAKSGANAARVFMYTVNGSGPNAATYVNVLSTQHIAYKEVPIVSMPVFPDGVWSSCNSSTTSFTNGLAWWVANAAAFAPLSKYLIVNIANEWGPSNSTIWRDSYINAIAQLRAAGYTSPIMIDSGGCGQDAADFLNYSTAVFQSDPQKNVIFGFHFYGLGMGPPYSTVDQMTTIFTQFAALSKAQGMVFAVTEFGPGRAIGPSPTNVTPGQVITAAEANGLGWLAWAWDDNNLAGCKTSDDWFGMTFSCGVYTQASDLTTYGKDVVLNPTYGLQVLAKPATIF